MPTPAGCELTGLPALSQSCWLWLHCKVTGWPPPGLPGLIPVQEKPLLAEGLGCPCGLPLSKAGYKFRLPALLLVGLQNTVNKKSLSEVFELLVMNN